MKYNILDDTNIYRVIWIRHTFKMPAQQTINQCLSDLLLTGITYNTFLIFNDACINFIESKSESTGYNVGIGHKALK